MRPSSSSRSTLKSDDTGAFEKTSGRVDAIPVIVIGAGGHAGVLINILRNRGRPILFATDPNPDRHGEFLDEVAVRGDDELVYQHATDQVELVNGVGSAGVPVARRDVFLRFRKDGYRFASVVHPSAVVETTASLGQGVQIMAGAVIQHKARLGANCLVNSRSSVGHDCVIEDHVHVSSGVTLCGGAVIGEATHVGAGATLIQNVRVGSGVLVAAGAVVTGDVADDSTVMGVPARPASREQFGRKESDV